MNDNYLIPLYQHQTKVRAAKITEILGTRHSAVLVLGDIGIAVNVMREFMDRQEPKVGGYFIKEDFGYTSFCSAKEFEKGYTKI